MADLFPNFRNRRSAANTGDFRPAAQKRAEQSIVDQVARALVRPGEKLTSKADKEQAAIEAMVNYLRQRRFTVEPPDRSDERESQYRTQQQPVTDFSYRQQSSGQGFGIPSGGYPANDPVMTGEMIRVSSSNVHSIGFRWNTASPTKGTLLVRYLESEPHSQAKKAGATYAYHDVHPQVFKAFESAASKGKFVWDRLRIRGTVAGKQYDYRLIGLGSSGHVPRQAAQFGKNQYFLRRQVQAANGQSMRSRLPDERVGRARPQRPGSGLPYQGRALRPSRGL